MAGTESERVNLPVHRGKEGTFENWVIVLFEPALERAYWIRYEVLAPEASAEVRASAILIAHVFDLRAASHVRFAKRVLPMDRVSFGPESRFHLRIDDAEIGHGFARGRAGEGSGEIAWDLRFSTQEEPVERTPTLLRHLPLPMRREHPHAEVRFDGTVSIGGEARDVRFALGAQYHSYGERRIEERRWLYAPALAEETGAAIELVQTRIHRHVLGLPAPAFASFWLRTGSEELGLAELREGWMHRVDAQATGSIHARSISANRAIVVHAHAPRDAMATHAYLDPDGTPRYVSKSAVADVTVEIFERPSRFGRFRPKQQLTARAAAALEILASEPAAGLVYAPFGAEQGSSHPDRLSSRIPGLPPTPGRFESFPEVHAIYAASSSYASHGDESVPETADPDEPVLLAKSHKSLLVGGDSVRLPASSDIVDSLLAIEPGLASVFGARYGFLPALLDYEVELGMVVLDDIEAADLDDPAFRPRLGWFVANDLTARVTQLFGHGQSDPRPYWELGKSFAGFCPVTHQIFVPEQVDLDSWPRVTLRTRVNGQLRQEAETKEIRHSPRDFLRACVTRRGGSLETGVVLLTGTPTGVAFRVPAWRRAIEDRLLDRFGRLEAACGLYLESPDFLRPGDRVVIDGGFLGSREIVITSGLAPASGESA